jgi:hypothetical protein
MLNENLDLNGASFVSLTVTPTTANPGDTITLYVSYHLSAITPFVQAIFGGTLTINAQAKEVVRGIGQPDQNGNAMTVQTSDVSPVNPVTDAAQNAGGCARGVATVSWTAVSATGYRVYRDGTLIDTITSGGTLGSTLSRTYSVGLGNTWNLSIKSYNNDGLTVTESDPMLFTIGCAAIQPTITAYRCPPNSTAFSWTMPTPIDTAVAKYTVYRFVNSSLIPKVVIASPSTMTGSFTLGTGDNTGSYVVQAQDSSGVALGSNSASVTINCLAGTGLKGQYYNDPTDGTSHFVMLAATRTDATVNFDWGRNTAPFAGINNIYYSVRWTGQVMPSYSESYNFYTWSDDGVRLWINGQLVIDNWNRHGAMENASTAIPLIAGQKYDIKLEYFELDVDATIKLSWSSTSQTKAIIAQTQLYPAP